MANVNAPYGFKFYRDNKSLAPAMEWGTLDSGQTAAEGDVLIRNSSGNLALHTGGAFEYPWGVAAAPGNPGDSIPYYPAEYSTLFKAQSIQSTVLDQTYVHKVFEVSGATGVMGVNTSGVTYPTFRVIDFLPGTTIGAYAELIGIFIRTGYEAAGGFSGA